MSSSSPPSRKGRITGPGGTGGLWATFAVLLALFAAIGTFLVLMGAFGLEPNQTIVLGLLGFDFLLIITLLGLVMRDLWRLKRESQAALAGARLQRRMVGLFSLVAAVPTAMVAGAALYALDRGLTPWFSGDLKALVTNSESIAQNFQQQLCQNMGREMRLFAADLDRASTTGSFLGNRPAFQSFLTSRATALGFPNAKLFKPDGSLVEEVRIPSRPYAIPQPTVEDFQFADTDEPPCLISTEGVGGLIRVRAFGPDTYLMVSRAVDPRALEFPLVARAGVVQYQALEQRRRAELFGIALVFALVTLIGLLGAVLLGFGYAAQLAEPIRRLMQATSEVSRGNLFVQVPVEKMGADLDQLGATFNTMTSVLRAQHDDLHSAGQQIDQRRRFMEAVLAGVPAGVIGLDAANIITLTNPMARVILGISDEDAVGHNIAEILPELGAMLADARDYPTRMTQTEFPLLRRGTERILSARATSDAAGGLVVTLDDISDLVAAQRTAAWSDVARRIAHEIKNPLTPIQLSAERIRRKFGKVIIEDRPIFDQCTDTIIRQVDDIKRMVDEFSSFARMPKPQMVVENLVDVLREVLFLMRVGNPAIRFEEVLPLTAVFAKIDRRLIAQALQNLIKNACESINGAPSGAAGAGRVMISIRNEGEAGLCLDIADNGKGFPIENRARLLEPYVTEREGGTGLGLPIVAKIFEDHGGRIELLDAEPNEHSQDRGALVRITLPPLPKEQA